MLQEGSVGLFQNSHLDPCFGPRFYCPPYIFPLELTWTQNQSLLWFFIGIELGDRPRNLGLFSYQKGGEEVCKLSNTGSLRGSKESGERKNWLLLVAFGSDSESNLTWTSTKFMFTWAGQRSKPRDDPWSFCKGWPREEPPDKNIGRCVLLCTQETNHYGKVKHSIDGVYQIEDVALAKKILKWSI